MSRSTGDRMRKLLAAATLLTGCTFEPRFLLVPADGARALVVVVMTERGPAGPVDATALDVEEPARRFSLGLPPCCGLTAYVLTYGCPLDALGLAPGPIALGEPDRTDLAPFPAAARIRRAAIDRDEPSAWTEPIGAVPEEIARLRTTLAPERCARPSPTSIELSDTPGERVTFLVAADRELALAGTSSGAFFSVGPDGATRLAALPNASTILAADRDPESGAIWLLGQRGVFLRRGLAGGFEERPILAGPPPLLSASIAASKGAVLASTDQGSIARFDGARWTVLERGPGAFVGKRHRVAALGSSRWVVVREVGRTAVWIEGDALRSEQPFGSAPISVAAIAGLGAVVGTSHGELIAADVAGAWRALESSFGGRPISAIVPFAAGFLFGGDRGLFARRDGMTPCEAETVLDDDAGTFAASPSGGRAFVARAGAIPGRNASVVVLEAQRPEQPLDCSSLRL